MTTVNRRRARQAFGHGRLVLWCKQLQHSGLRERLGKLLQVEDAVMVDVELRSTNRSSSPAGIRAPRPIDDIRRPMTIFSSSLEILPSLSRSYILYITYMAKAPAAAETFAAASSPRMMVNVTA